MTNPRIRWETSTVTSAVFHDRHFLTIYLDPDPQAGIGAMWGVTWPISECSQCGKDITHGDIVDGSVWLSRADPDQILTPTFKATDSNAHSNHDRWRCPHRDCGYLNHATSVIYRCPNPVHIREGIDTGPPVHIRKNPSDVRCPSIGSCGWKGQRHPRSVALYWYAQERRTKR